MDDKKRMLLADGALLLSAATWAGGYIAADIAVEYFQTFTIMTIRFLAAALMMFLLFRRVVLRAGKAEIKSGLILGTILFFAQPLQVIALRYTTPSKQVLLVSSYVALVPFLSWLMLKKRPQIRAFIAGFLTVVGVAFISLDGSFSIALGDGLSLLFAASYAFSLVLTGIFVLKCEPIAMSFYSYLATGALSLIMSVFFEGIPTGVGMEGIGAMVYLVIGSTCLAYTLQNVAQRYTSDTHAALIISLESIFGFIFGVFFYGDPFTMKLLIGGLIVFGSVVFSVVDFKKKPQKIEE